MRERPTDLQLQALTDLSDGQPHYGIEIRGRHSLPSLRKRGLVAQEYGDGSADRWQIRPEGREALRTHGTLKHLRAPSSSVRSDG